ncbi:hypothetical protein CONLIGDRAFT_186026 [Coniochaeta ligniaria NRRL 30616]|uniref:Glutamate--tRNA ligase, mitochondrial n=1 Tax=Coniochaeta ligniaria NRRL 30616 TaxID=1408157 RepID=A0A1J7JUC1_9PEZI|nr:hypothetical protein CONLIGDRAFT_186026 [Coniochaeta ligniaria NRRL 30616]
MMPSHLVLRRQLCPAHSLLRNLHAISRRRVSALSRSDKSRVAPGQEEDRQLNNTSQSLPETPCRTRFAPSPTGYLHLGSLRTALYNYLLAKATNGQFVLRLEDTDQSRLVADAEQRLYEDLKWAGLTWDEGPDVGGPYGPYRQSERLSLYDEHSNRLIEEGKAYRCFCPPDQLADHKLAHRDLNSPPPPNPCIHISAEESSERAAKDESHCVVFKASPEPTEIRDLVYGSFKRRLPESDFILRKTDGFPTYHFANVVDDHAMKITHVVRGAEWLVSTPKHVELYRALQWEPPAFAHVGLLVDPQRQKLSKRALGADLSSYKRDGIIPSALLNFVALLGWSPGTVEDEVMALEEMVEKFRLRFTKGDIMVKLPGKLDHFDFFHKRRLLEEEPPNMALLQEYVLAPLEESIDKFLSRQISEKEPATGESTEPQMIPRAAAAYSTDTGKIVQPDFFLNLLRLQTNRTKKNNTVQDVPLHRRHLIWQVPEPFLVRALRKPRLLDAVLGTKTTAEVGSDTLPPRPLATRGYSLISQALDHVTRELEKVPPESWTRDNIPWSVEKGTELWALLSAQLEPNVPPETLDKKTQIAFSELVRWALVASDSAPSNKEVMAFLGRDESLKRISTAAGVARKVAEQPEWQPEGFDWTEAAPTKGR